MIAQRIDNSWTLFLDRDGVLNRRVIDGYVVRVDEFEWLPGVVPALVKLTSLFGTTVVVTNQQGVGKGLMQQEDLDEIHSKLLQQASFAGANIDRVYACPALAAAQDECRKPSPGMAHQAKAEFPAIDFKRSIMVGDTASDMAFARAAGMYAVFIGEAGATASAADARFDNLYAFSQAEWLG